MVSLWFSYGFPTSAGDPMPPAATSRLCHIREARTRNVQLRAARGGTVGRLYLDDKTTNFCWQKPTETSDSTSKKSYPLVI